MAKMTMNEINYELSDEELKELNNAEMKKSVFDNDSPKMTAKMLSEFKRINRQNRIKQTVSLRLSVQTIQQAKSFGNKGYTSFLSRLIDLAINNQDLVKRCL